MRTNLLEFLFGRAATATAKEEAKLGEDIVKLFEEADEVEGIELVANKKPLGDALKTMGIDEPVEACAQWAEIHCDDDPEYKEYIRILTDPDNMHKLAQMGWVMARCGDSAMSQEVPDYKIGFIEIATAEGGEADKPDEKVKAIIKQGQEFATAPVAKDDEMNPVDRETGKPDTKLTGKTTGVGKAKDGEDPEGKPKGSTKKAESMVDKLLTDPLQEMTGTTSMGTVDAGMPPKATFIGTGSVPPVMAHTGLRAKKRRMQLKGKASDALRP